MTTATPQPPEPGFESKSVPRDLRAELQTNLLSQFAINLKAARTLTDTAAESLVALLNAKAPTTADVVKALALEDPIKVEAPSE